MFDFENDFHVGNCFRKEELCIPNLAALNQRFKPTTEDRQTKSSQLLIYTSKFSQQKATFLRQILCKTLPFTINLTQGQILDTQ